jgi:hypothetical protein
LRVVDKTHRIPSMLLPETHLYTNKTARPGVVSAMATTVIFDHRRHVLSGSPAGSGMSIKSLANIKYQVS